MSHEQLGKDSLWAQAARFGDALAEEAGIEHATEAEGIEIEELAHCAEQRALRAVLKIRGRHHELWVIQSTGIPFPVALSADEREMLTSVTALYMDGLYIGWKARGLSGPCLSADEAAYVAESLRALAEVDEGENTDYDRLTALAERLSGEEGASE